MRMLSRQYHCKYPVTSGPLGDVKVCTQCKQSKSVLEFRFDRGRNSLNSACKKCTNKRRREWCYADARALLLLGVSQRATRDGEGKYRNELKKTDIPTPKKCVYLGVDLVYCAGPGDVDNRASVDRIDSKLGYFPENIQVISWLANSMKNRATLSNLIRFAQGVLSAHCPEYLSPGFRIPISSDHLSPSVNGRQRTLFEF